MKLSEADTYHCYGLIHCKNTRGYLGPGGSTIRNIRFSTGAMIRLRKCRLTIGTMGRMRGIKIWGTAKQVVDAIISSGDCVRDVLRKDGNESEFCWTMLIPRYMSKDIDIHACKKEYKIPNIMIEHSRGWDLLHVRSDNTSRLRNLYEYIIMDTSLGKFNLEDEIKSLGKIAQMIREPGRNRDGRSVYGAYNSFRPPPPRRNEPINRSYRPQQHQRSNHPPHQRSNHPSHERSNHPPHQRNYPPHHHSNHPPPHHHRPHQNNNLHPPPHQNNNHPPYQPNNHPPPYQQNNHPPHNPQHQSNHHSQNQHNPPNQHQQHQPQHLRPQHPQQQHPLHQPPNPNQKHAPYDNHSSNLYSNQTSSMHGNHSSNPRDNHQPNNQHNSRQPQHNSYNNRNNTQHNQHDTQQNQHTSQQNQNHSHHNPQYTQNQHQQSQHNSQNHSPQQITHSTSTHTQEYRSSTHSSQTQEYRQVQSEPQYNNSQYTDNKGYHQQQYDTNKTNNQNNIKQETSPEVECKTDTISYNYSPPIAVSKKKYEYNERIPDNPKASSTYRRALRRPGKEETNSGYSVEHNKPVQNPNITDHKENKLNNLSSEQVKQAKSLLESLSELHRMFAKDNDEEDDKSDEYNNIKIEPSVDNTITDPVTEVMQNKNINTMNTNKAKMSPTHYPSLLEGFPAPEIKDELPPQTLKLRKSKSRKRKIKTSSNGLYHKNKSRRAN